MSRVCAPDLGLIYWLDEAAPPSRYFLAIYHGSSRAIINQQRRKGAAEEGR